MFVKSMIGHQLQPSTRLDAYGIIEATILQSQDTCGLTAEISLRK
jgi:hypothetical protein